MGNFISLHALGVLAQATPAGLGTGYPNTSASQSCHFAFPPSREGFQAMLWGSAFHREAQHLLFYSQALPGLPQAPPLLHCNGDVKTSNLPTGAPQPALTREILTSTRFLAHALMRNLHKPVAFNFLSLFQPALGYLFKVTLRRKLQ